MMNKWSLTQRVSLLACLIAVPGISLAAYISGSTGMDGEFKPTASQSVQIPPSGIFNFTTVNIPAGVTITFKKNATNTPVTLLASGDVTITGTIDISATAPADPGDISGPGIAGPGGYNGGRGGQAGGDPSTWVNGFASHNIGRAGTGPGGGAPGRVYSSTPWGLGISNGGGGAYGSAPAAPSGSCSATPGVTYGNLTLLPLIGGSGGGGGVGGSTLPGWGGGGGGGAILIAASGTINVTGAVLANGGSVFRSGADGRGSPGGGGSGGAIRLIATTISGNGTISAVGGNSDNDGNGINGYLACSVYGSASHYGGAGRIRLESETLTRTSPTNPLYVGGPISVTSIPGLPALSISSIAGIPVPATPTGTGDVKLPAGTPNPVTVVFNTKGVTVGSTIKLTVLPPTGPATSVTSAPTTGTMDNATASVDINVPGGSSALQASVTYTVVASVGSVLSTYAQGEQVEKVRLNSVLSGPSTATLITVSGKEYTIPAALLASSQG